MKGDEDKRKEPQNQQRLRYNTFPLSKSTINVTRSIFVEFMYEEKKEACKCGREYRVV
jgi:hypothetical protein